MKLNYITAIFLIFIFKNEADCTKPNIIIILADDLGYNDVGFHGSNQIPTPNIDALAYNGIILDRFYTQSTCTPSRTALLTGNYPIRSGMQGYPLKAGENRAVPYNMTTIPEHLKRLGYKTHLVGKWHLGAAFRNVTPTGRGYDTHFGYWNGLIGYFDYVSFTKYNGTLIKGFDLHDQFEPAWTNQGKYATDVFTEKTLEIIENHNTEEPMFLVLSHLAPHSGKDGVELGVPNVTLTNLKYPYIKNQRRRLYTDIVNLLDKSVGQVMKKLSEKNMLENSIVLFCSDNGGETVGMYENSASNWPLRGVKFSEFEGGVRTAAAIFSPLFKKRGYVNKELIHITDWMPTFYSAAGGDVEDLGTIDGKDQWRVLCENVPTNRSEILVNINENDDTFAIISHSGRYKLLQGTFKNGTYDKYCGESGRADTPPYNTEDILQSSTNQVIINVTKTLLTTEQIYKLRSQSNLSWCRDASKTIDIDCTERCLFDLQKDPCETTNIIKTEKSMAEKMYIRIEDFRRVLVPIRSTNWDPNSNPRFYNNTWCTWLDDALCFKTTNIEIVK